MLFRRVRDYVFIVRNTILDIFASSESLTRVFWRLFCLVFFEFSFQCCVLTSHFNVVFSDRYISVSCSSTSILYAVIFDLSVPCSVFYLSFSMFCFFLPIFSGFCSLTFLFRVVLFDLSFPCCVLWPFFSGLCSSTYLFPVVFFDLSFPGCFLSPFISVLLSLNSLFHFSELCSSTPLFRIVSFNLSFL